MKEPKIGLALGSGGARGLAHIGVLKIFERENIPVHMIAGSSIGALVGTLYAAGQNIEKMLDIASSFKKYFIDVTMPKLGFISGNHIKISSAFSRITNTWKSYSIPVAVIATDIHTGEK